MKEDINTIEGKQYPRDKSTILNLQEEVLKLKYQIVETQALYYQAKLDCLTKDKMILDLIGKNPII
jgi:hypothetical protein